MVVEEDRAGAVVLCPNCRRSLKVPSGTDRGVHIAAAPSTVRTSRMCQRCGKEVPVDSQMCPHCKAVLLDAQGAPAPAKAAGAPAGKRTSAAAATMAGQTGGAIRYGGSQGGWFSRLSSGGKAGVVGGIVAFVGVFALVAFLIYSGWSAGQLSGARSDAKAALEAGRKLEAVGDFQQAYELCSTADNRKEFLLKSGKAEDAQLADAVAARFDALTFLAKEPKIRGDLFWKPTNQEEYNEAKAELQKTYQPYKEWVLAVAEAGIAAAQFGKATPGNRAGYEQKVIQAMDTYVKFVSKASEYQRAQRTFKQVLEGMKALGGANSVWEKPKERDNYLNMADAYLGAAKECASLGQDDLVAR
ncbi:MAG: zinc ribbon domain-containing protein [Planctomycetota bacterium]|nr:zinc ribbon domain-containing protein [Planctomycetota bacterium]